MNKNEREFIKIRKSYYGFAKNYPGKLGSSKYVIGDSKIVRRREFIRKILIAILILVIFISSFIVTSVCLEISEKPIEAKNSPVIMTGEFL